ncbi:MAG: VWA domain-containing protein [Spongiibacteraceae bacterium]
MRKNFLTEWRLTTLLRATLLLLSILHGGMSFAAGEPQKPDVRVLIDISGSMKQNDPNNLRRPAYDLLVGLFPKGSKAGVWTFGEGVDVLVPDKNVSDGWRAIARSKTTQISSTSLYTNIPAALEAAAQNPDPAYRTSIILLTDGMVDISKTKAENEAARRRLLGEIVPKLRQAGIAVHTVALSKSADRELMERLAADTGGLFAVAESADQLKRVFLQAFDAAAPAEQVPLANNRFLVDSSIDELTTLVMHKPGKPVELVSPDNKRHSATSHGDDFKWFQGDGFDLITVTKPFEGEWQIAAELEEGSRVTIVSNLSLSASRYADSVFVDGSQREMVAALKQQGEVIKEASFIKLVKFGVAVQRREDGKQWSIDLSTANPTPADGYFRSAMAMLSEQGTYELTVTAEAKTFQRSQKQTVSVRENFDVSVKETDSVPPGHRITLLARNPEIDPATTTATAHIKTADGATSEQSVTAAEREWLLTLEAADHEGRVEVYFDIAGQNKKGEKFNYRSATVAVDQNGGQVVAPAQKEPAPEAKHEEPKAEAAHEQPAKEEAAHGEAKHEDAHAEPAPAEKKKDWKKWVLYGGLVFGNLLIIGLGFVAYRVIMGGGKSKVLEESDEDAEESAEKAGGEKGGGDKKKEGKEKAKRAKADLPDDAIDIDAGKK